MIPEPPDPFRPRTATLGTGTQLYRCYTAEEGRTATTFNPGFGSPTRFGFFGNPLVPVLYAAASEQAAVAETLLHDVPVIGGRLFAAGVDQLWLIDLCAPLHVDVLLGD